MMRDIFEEKGELLRAYAKLIWYVISLVALAAALAAGLWALFEGLHFTNNQTTAALCSIILMDMWIKYRERKRRERNDS